MATEKQTVLTVKFAGVLANDFRIRELLAEEGAIEINGENICFGCHYCEIPGIRWPASPDGDSSRSWVNKCDSCERFEDDLDASIAVAMSKGCNVGLALPHDGGMVIHPDTQLARSKLYKVWEQSPNYTTPFVNREERDS